jgi:hypothetical protein
MKKLQFDFNGNMGGISRMFAIPLTSFKRIRRDFTNKLNYLEVINREDIIDIYFTENTDSFSEDYEDGLYSVQINAVNPKSNKLNQQQLIRLETENWIVLFQDNNNMVRLAGNEDYSLDFRRNDTTGQMDTRNQVNFSFYGSMATPCEFIELTEMDDL